MSCIPSQTGGKKNKRGGSQLEQLVLTGGNLKGGLVLGGGDAGEYPGAYGAAAQAGGIGPITPGQGGGRRSRRLSRRKGHARKARTRSTCAGGSKKRKSRKSGGSKKRGGKSRKY